MIRFLGPIRLRTYLFITSLVSIGAILVSLFISYWNMLLNFDQVAWLTAVTLAAGILSLLLHRLMTRPIETALDMISKESERIAEGDFRGELPLIGPTEYRELGMHFNEMSRKLNESFQQLRSSEASRRELIANVSHDLRTPMASIQSFVEALEDDLIEDPATYRRYLDTIRLETRRLSEMINDLFELSRREAGVELERFEPVPYHVDNMLVETLQSHRLQIEAKHIQMKGDVQELLPPVLIMPDQIKRVLSNLLNNAVRHSPVGGNITVRAYQESVGSQWITIEVADEGEGIRPEEQAKVFERFYRTDKSRSRASGGSGLGLAITRSLVELHGGQVGVSSQAGSGSRFWFTIPVYAGSSLH